MPAASTARQTLIPTNGHYSNSHKKAQKAQEEIYRIVLTGIVSALYFVLFVPFCGYLCYYQFPEFRAAL